MKARGRNTFFHFLLKKSSGGGGGVGWWGGEEDEVERSIMNLSTVSQEMLSYLLGHSHFV